RRAGAVGVAGGAGREPPAAILVLVAAKPPGRARVAPCGPGGAKRQDPERREVHLASPGAIPPAPGKEPPAPVTALEVARIEPRAPQDQDRPLQVAGGGDLADGPREIADRRRIAVLDVPRVDAGRLQAQCGPARHRRARLLAAIEPEAPVPVLRP